VAVAGTLESRKLLIAPGTPVALNDAGVARPETEAVAVFAPTVVERVHPQETRPEAVVDVVQEDSVPLAADQETVTLGTGLEYWSLTTATIFEDTAVPTVADWLLPELTEIVAAASAVPVAEKLAGG